MLLKPSLWNVVRCPPLVRMLSSVAKGLPPLLERPAFPSEWSSIPLLPSNLSLANTLPVGQSFLWHRQPLQGPSVVKEELLADIEEIGPLEEFSRAVDNPPRVILLRQSTTKLYYATLSPDTSQDAAAIEAKTLDFIDKYFQLSRFPSLPAMYDDWRARDPGLFGRLDVASDPRALGIRVLRQDVWECLISFITSTNNHISRITGLLHRLSAQFSDPLLQLPPGDTIAKEPTTYHVFPAPHRLPSGLDPAFEALLRDLGFGYRAGFITSTLETLREEFGTEPGNVEAGLESWRAMAADEARNKFVNLKGVGRKVADCVMLMSCDKHDLIPIDTHLNAIAARHPKFPSKYRNKPMSKQLYTDVQDFLAALWGPQGGWTQAVMFAVDLPVKGGTPRKAKAEIDVSSESSGLVTPAGSVKDELLSLDDGSPLKRKAAVVAAAAMATKRAKPIKVKSEVLASAASRVREESPSTPQKDQ